MAGSSGIVVFFNDFGDRLMSRRGYGESTLIDGNRLICTPGGADAMFIAINPNLVIAELNPID